MRNKIFAVAVAVMLGVATMTTGAAALIRRRREAR